MEGQARMMHRMAVRKLGPETADRLLGRLGGLDDFGRLAGEERTGLERPSCPPTTHGPATDTRRVFSPSGGLFGKDILDQRERCAALFTQEET